MTVPPLGRGELHHTMIALKLQQFQCTLKKSFLRRLVFPRLFGPSDGYPPPGLNWSGVDPPLSSSRACLTTFIAISVP